MSLTPGYGDTPVDGDELDALLPAAKDLLGSEVTKAAVYDLEQAVQEDATERLLTVILDGALTTYEVPLRPFATGGSTPGTGLPITCVSRFMLRR